MWDFSRGRLNKTINFGNEGDGGQCCNTSFVHPIVVPDRDIVDKVGEICVVARGDGIVNIIDVKSELAELKSKNPAKSKKGSKAVPKSGVQPSDSQSHDQNDKRRRLDYTMGGHVAAVSSVAFLCLEKEGCLSFQVGMIDL